MKSTIHLPGLNGIRAIACIAVVLSHTSHALGDFGINTTNLGFLTSGITLAGYGVTMFFCLSGFLITFLLLHEKSTTGTIEIKQFYIRRALRIWPLYYSFLLLGSLYMYITNGFIDNANQLPFYIFLSANIPVITGHAILLFAHYWSLGVEEQFYLFWPWLGKLKINQLFIASIVIIVIALMAKLALRLTIKNFDENIFYISLHITRFHCMAMGAAASIMYYKNIKWFLAICQHIVTQIIVFTSIIFMLFNKFHIASFIDNEIVGILSIALILGQVDPRNRIVNLNKPLFNFFGKISYGIYVIHPILIIILSRIIHAFDMNYIMRFALAYISVMIITTLVAHLSYRYFERPFLKIKTKYMIINSSATGIH
ncbi:acyltransferase family protein [Hymenobacter guriensis]|uniref:Acyltransferase n=1 Tax=Hymenobacter guriensis TaxID=2793065 RepID=A0ABS0L3K6_9BACT|nr:acyltransferase [Hymenobacter guriensis]MBG8554646.1 acyltransferase [Hymenobacter guriensis]